PRGPGTLKRAMVGGLAVAFVGPPGGGYAVRELFALFDRAGKATEVRVRCTDAPGQPGGAAKLLGRLKAKCGEPEALAAPWAAAWADLPARKPAPVLYRWQHDVTQLT